MIWYFLALSLSYIIGGLSWSYDIIWHHWFRWIISSLSSVVPKLIWIFRCWEHRIIKYSNTYHPYHEWSWNIIPILVVPKFHQVFRVPKLRPAWDFFFFSALAPRSPRSRFVTSSLLGSTSFTWVTCRAGAVTSLNWGKKNEVQSDPIANTI